MATKRKSTTTKKTTAASPAVEETPVITEETKVESPVVSASVLASIEHAEDKLDNDNIELVHTSPIVNEEAPAVEEKLPIDEPVPEEVKEEEKPAPKKTSSSKSKATNKYAEEEKKYREMAKEAGIELPEYKYDDNAQLTGATLTGAEIVRQMIMGNIEIDGFDMKNLNPNSYNLTLGNSIKTYRPVYQSKNKNDHSMYLDILKDNPYEEITITEEGFALVPGKVYIATTNERTFSSKFQPKIDGRSSVGRLGIMVHLTAGYGDIGFDGKWTLELAVIQPIIIYPNIPICQVSFMVPAGDTSIQYNGRYQHQTDAETSKFFLK